MDFQGTHCQCDYMGGVMEILLYIGLIALGITLGAGVTVWRFMKVLREESDHQKEMRKSAERSRNEQ